MTTSTPMKASASATRMPGSNDEGMLLQPASKHDFQVLRELCTQQGSGWVEAHKSDVCSVFTMETTESSVARMKITSDNEGKNVFEGVTAQMVFEVLMDFEYLAEWDKSYIASHTLHIIDDNNRVSYYSAALPFPLKSRDWVNKLSWAHTKAPKDEFSDSNNGDNVGICDGDEWMIMNCSIKHSSWPEKAGFVRANSIRSGFVLKAINGGKGTNVSYFAHNEFNGWIPSWAINYSQRKFAPMYVQALLQAVKKYPEWKKTNKLTTATTQLPSQPQPAITPNANTAIAATPAITPQPIPVN